MQFVSRRHADDLLQETWLRLPAGLRGRKVRRGGPGKTSGRSEISPNCCSRLSALPESHREVIVMLKVSGMSLEEVARATSSNVGSVKQKAQRDYEKLRKWLVGGPAAGRVALLEG